MDINSVIIYVLTFTISFINFKLGENYLFAISNKKYIVETHYIDSKVIQFYFFTAIGLSVPCLLAAFRADNVGMDVVGYILPNYNMARSASINLTYFLKHSINNLEPLFAIVLYFCAKINSLKLFLFTIQLLVVLPLYIVLFKFKDVSLPSFGMIVYYFLLYNFSLSGTKQAIAISFVLLGWSNIKDKKYITTLILFLIAFLFHRSSIAVEIIIILIIAALNVGKNHIVATCSLIGGALTFVFLFYNRLVPFIINFARLISSGKYVYYFNSRIQSSYQGIFKTDLLLKSIILIISLFAIYWSKIKLNVSYIQIICFAIIGRFFIIFMTNFYESSRIAYYFDAFLILLISIIVKGCFKKERKNLLAVQSLILAPVIAYWLYFIMYTGAYGTNLYKFAW